MWRYKVPGQLQTGWEYPISPFPLPPNIKTLYTIAKTPQNRRWRRCCVIGTALWNRLTTPTTTLGVMNLLALQQSYDITLQPWEFAQQLWDCHIVLSHKLCNCCTAVRQTEKFRHKRRALFANPPHKIIHNPGYLCFRIVLIMNPTERTESQSGDDLVTPCYYQWNTTSLLLLFFVCSMYDNYCLVVQIKFYECCFYQEEKEQRDRVL